MKTRWLSSVEPQPDYRLRVTWKDGPTYTFDFRKIFGSGPAFEALLRDEALFRKVRIDEWGRTIEWPEPADEHGDPLIDFGAESLLRIALSEKNAEAGELASLL